MAPMAMTMGAILLSFSAEETINLFDIIQTEDEEEEEEECFEETSL